MWEWGYRYKIWYLDKNDGERYCTIQALNAEMAMDVFLAFDKHQGLQIIAIDEE